MRITLRAWVAAAAALVAAVMLVTHASALSITTAAITFSEVTLDGTNQPVYGTTSAAWRAGATGESGGWNVTVATTGFANAECKTIDMSNFEIRLLDANIAYVSGIDNIDLPIHPDHTRHP